MLDLLSGPATRSRAELSRLIASAAEPLHDLDDAEFANPFDRFADAKRVLLGEASHGTSEFYHARAAITRRLIERHGFTVVAAEADWPGAALVATTWNVRCPRSSTRTSGSRRCRP